MLWFLLKEKPISELTKKDFSFLKFFFFLKASNLTQNFFCCRGQDNQSNLLFFLQMIRRERTKKKDDVFPNLPSLHCVWFLRYQCIILLYLSAQNFLLHLKDLLNKWELKKYIAKRKNVTTFSMRVNLLKSNIVSSRPSTASSSHVLNSWKWKAENEKKWGTELLLLNITAIAKP